MGIPIYQVDAFTSQPFAGNPAAVCLLTQPLDDTRLQHVAAEMNLSETAFLLPVENAYQLRWFTPKVEVDLCGHATLASAHALWTEGHVLETREIIFHTRSGVLRAALGNDRIQLDFPLEPAEPAPIPTEVLGALGVSPVWAGKNRFDFLIEVESEESVRGMRPDFGALARVASRGVIVTARSESPDYDFVSRFFAPAAGIDEDPVTGSAHCCLGPYWQDRLGKHEFVAFQASSRGGIVYVRVGHDRTYLAGHAVTVLRGELCSSL